MADEKELTREQLIKDLDAVIEAWPKSDYPPAPPKGFNMEHPYAAIRRIAKGECIAISRRYVEAIRAALAEPNTVDDSAHYWKVQWQRVRKSESLLLAQINKLMSLMRSRHPIGKIKHISQLKAVEAAEEYIESLESDVQLLADIRKAQAAMIDKLNKHD